MKKILKKISCFLAICVCVFSLCACGESENTEKIESEQAEYMGILGTDFSLSVFDDEPVGKSFTFNGVYWGTRSDDYGYSFSYKEHNEDGTTAVRSFFVKDATENGDFSVMNEVSYEDEVAVKITAVFDKTQVITGEESGTTQIIYYVTAKEMELIGQESSEAKDATGDYYYIGDTIMLDNGITYTLVDGGVYSEYGQTYVYLELDIENGSGQDLHVGATDAAFYADDYVLETGYPIEQGHKNFVNTSISDGRKGNGRFYAECQNYDAISRIEVEIGNVIVVLKDDSFSLDNMDVSSADLVYGTYTYDNGQDAVCTAEIGIFSEDESDYISISCIGYGGHEIISFMGTLEEGADGTYSAVSMDYQADITVDFTDGGLQVKVEDTEFDSLFSVEGFYEVESLMDWSNVG